MLRSSRSLVDPSRPPPGPFRPGFWRSPLRGGRLTAVLGLVLLIGLPIVIITGLLSNDAYQPGLGGNALGRHLGPLDLYLFGWPTRPVWLYAVTQGLHVTIGLGLFPVLLAKLWSVIPRLFEWPPVRSPAHALERLSLALLVGGALFEFATGILNIQYWYAFPFSFVQAHYYGAWVFTGAFVAHASLKFGTMRRSLATRGAVIGLDEATVSGPARRFAPVPLESPASNRPTMTRRALFATVGAGSALLFVQGAAQSIGGPLRPLAFLLPRGRVRPGPLGFAVNKTWAVSGIPAREVASGWRLELVGAHRVSLSREELLSMPQRTDYLPIACVEGWSTTQRWSGVPLRDLAALCGLRGAASVTSASLEHGTYGHATLGHEPVADERSLLALRVTGLALSLDHGFPARVISPAVPGVHCTKWVSTMTFREERA